MKLIVNPQQFFFDRAKVIAALERATVKALSKIGAFVRRSARSSIRSAGKKNRVSNPGEAPRSHTGLLKDHIFFVYDPESKAVVIGPEKLRGTDGSAPAVLEYGGNAKIVETETPAWWTINNGVRVWRRFGKRTRGKLNQQGMPNRIRIVKIAPRPYMIPALEREKSNDKLAKQWENVLGTS